MVRGGVSAHIPSFFFLVRRFVGYAELHSPVFFGGLSSRADSHQAKRGLENHTDRATEARSVVAFCTLYPISVLSSRLECCLALKKKEQLSP